MNVQTLHHHVGWPFFNGDEICEEMVAFIMLPGSTTGAEICKADTFFSR